LNLSCRYQIRIDEPQASTFSNLPILHVEDIESIPDRHFRRNKAACLCSPLEERDFLKPRFEFRRFLEELVIPFLYGQSFYSIYQHWPWKEYAHDVTGLLESFSDCPNACRDEVHRLFELLALYEHAWPRVRAVLEQHTVKGHTSCFCPKRDHIRRCHPKALAGIRRLHRSIRDLNISVP
jgi:hypothetical protein